MQSRTALVMAATSLLMGCAAATSRLAPPEVVHVRPDQLHVELGTLSATGLQDVLPSTLARFGYFITNAQRAEYGTELLTDWQVSGAGERTRLVVRSRPRAGRFAVSIYAVTYVQDEAGHWREARPSPEVKAMLRDVSSQVPSTGVRAGGRP